MNWRILLGLGAGQTRLGPPGEPGLGVGVHTGDPWVLPASRPLPPQGQAGSSRKALLKAGW